MENNTTSGMKWKLVRESAEVENYELKKGDQGLLSLHYNKHLHTARIDSADGKRMFMIEREGFLRSRTVLKNEYGVRIGWLGFEKTPTQEDNFIELNDERFYYTFRNSPAPELVIFKTGVESPLLVCELGPVPVFAEKKDEINQIKNSCLLIALCWFRLMNLTTLGTQAALVH